MIGVNPRRHELPDRELLEGQVQEHGVVLEEVEAVPGDLAAGSRSRSGRAPCRSRRGPSAVKSKVAGRADLAELPARRPRSAPTGASGWVRLGMRPSRCFSSASSRLERLLAARPTSALSRFPSATSSARVGRVLLLAGRLGDLVLPAADLLDLLEQALALALQLDDAVDLVERRRPGRCGCGSSA